MKKLTLNKIKYSAYIFATTVAAFILNTRAARAGDDRGIFTGMGGGLCDVVVVIGNIKNIAITYLGPTAVLFIVIAGVMYTLSGANPEMQKKANSALRYSIMGLVIVLSAWVIITLIFVAMGVTDPNLLNWWKTPSCN